MGLANGFVIPVAQRYGAKDYKDMRRFVANSIWLTVFFAAIMSITVCILCRSVLIAMKTPADILDLAYDYIFIIFAGIPITLAYNLLTGIIRSLGDSKSPLIFLLMAAVANIGFDILSVTVLKLGVRGPAFATLLAQAFSVVLSLWCIKTKFPILKMEPGEWKLHGKHIGILCKMGIPMGLQYSITAIGSVVLQTGINTLGSAAVASVSAASKLSMFLACPFERSFGHGNLHRTECRGRQDRAYRSGIKGIRSDRYHILDPDFPGHAFFCKILDASVHKCIRNGDHT